MKLNNILTATAVATLCATSASAVSLTITGIDGVWENPAPASGISGVGTNEIKWGTPFKDVPKDDPNYGKKSGYVFDAADTSGSGLDVEENVVFSLGTFTHKNFPITGTSLDSVDLAVDLTISGAESVNPISTVFSFDHIETRNDDDPCPYGGGEGDKDCPDLVTATLNLGLTEFFTIGDTDYVFNILGFKVGDSQFTSFLTDENKANEVQLLAQFQTRTSVVPLPAAGWMLLAGLGGMAALRRRKKAQ